VARDLGLRKEGLPHIMMIQSMTYESISRLEMALVPDAMIEIEDQSIFGLLMHGCLEKEQ